MATRIGGLDRLNRQLAALAPTIRKRAAAQLAAQARETADAVQRAAPDAELARSVGFSQGAAPGGAILGGGALGPIAARKADAGLLFTVHAGDADAFWARWTEFGTAPHSVALGAKRKSGKYQDRGPFHPGAKASPFFWPTIRSRARLNKRRLQTAGRQAARDLAKIR